MYFCLAQAGRFLPQTWPKVLLLLSFLVLLFLHARSFSLWYYGEDYLWLYYVSGLSFLEVIRPAAGAFYRPLSTNIPFYVFSRFEEGRLVWKALAFACLGISAGWMWAWTKDVSRSPWIALWLTVAWLFNPAQSFGLLYVVAFNYILSPMFLLGFFYCLQKRKFGAALVCFILGLLVKEFFIAVPILFLLWRKEYSIPMKFFWISLAVAALSLLFRGGISLEQKRMGVYALSFDFASLAGHIRYLTGKTFFGATGFPSVDAWYWYAWGLVIAAVAGAALIPRSRREMVGVYRHFLAAFIFFVPVALIPGVLTEDLGPFYWIFLFGAAAEAWAALQWKIRGAWGAATLGVLGFWLHGFSAGEFRERYIGLEAKYFQLVQKSLPLLSVCGKFDQIVTVGLEEIFESELYAEFAALALRRAQPGARFYLLNSGKAPRLRGIPKNAILWVDQWQADGHPTLIYSKDLNQGVSVSWKGNARCRTSVEVNR